MQNPNAQSFLFERIKELRPDAISLVDLIAETLHISNDSAYRRIRGETPLVLDEAFTLCEEFGISFDQLLQMKGNSIVFDTIRFNKQRYSFEKYLVDILERLKAVASAKEKHIFYLTKDIPLFHHFVYKPVFAFRYFFWMKSIFHDEDFESRVFTPDCLPPKIEQLGKLILETYNSIPSTEIWNTECVNSIIFQIEYYREAGFFNSTEDIQEVYSALELTSSHLQKQAEIGTKFLPGETSLLKHENFDFFFNRVILGDNTILVKTENINSVFLNFEVLNYLSTSDTDFFNETYSGILNIMKRSTMISHASEKQRNMFFNILNKKIEERRNALVF